MSGDLRARLEAEAFAIEEKLREARGALAGIRDPLERRAGMIRVQRLADDHQRCLNALFSIDAPKLAGR